MRTVLEYLNEREDEFARHLSIAKMLEERVDKEVTEDETIQVEIRHINTLKSGLLIHLYNIVEAIATRTLEEVGRVIVKDKPRSWTEEVLSEWVRAVVWNGEDRMSNGVLKRLTTASSDLASGKKLKEFVVKGEPGSWNDNAIKKVAERLGCELRLSDGVRRLAYERVYRDDTTALKFLSQRRNAIAHGASTFEEGARDLTLDELSGLASRVIPYLREVTKSYDSYLNSKSYLLDKEEAI